MARRLLDRSRSREVRRQAVLLNKLARQFRPLVERELAAAMMSMVDHWEQTHLVDMPRGFVDRMGALYLQMADASIRAFASRIMDQGKAAGILPERKFIDFGQIMNTLASVYIGLESVRRRIASVTETTRQQIIGAVKRGYDAGTPVREVAKNIRETVPTISRVRAHVIARTETHGAANFGSNEAAKRTGLPLRREWLAAHDLRTRTVDPLIGDPDEFGHLQVDGQISDKFARTEAAAFVNGDGVNKPRGFLTYTAGTTLPGTIEQFPTGASGALASAPSGGDALIDALYGLKAPYRANATWFMNRSSVKLVRKAKDSDGAYLWQPGIAAGQPATLLGYPVASFEDMPDPASGSLSIAVGDMREAYQIVDRIGIRTLRDPYTAKPYVVFYTIKRVGGDVVNFEALKIIRLGA